VLGRVDGARDQPVIQPTDDIAPTAPVIGR
jgi:hypothetical protein